mgnify:CR=1 FL=1
MARVTILDRLKVECGAVSDSLSQNPYMDCVAVVVAEAKRVLSRLIMGHPVEKPGRRRTKPERPARLRFERVTIALLDEENFEGSTKGLTDCLRYAFPTLLIDDAKGYVEIEHVQTRCGSKCEQGTWVELVAGCSMLDAGCWLAGGCNH